MINLLKKIYRFLFIFYTFYISGGKLSDSAVPPFPPIRHFSANPPFRLLFYNLLTLSLLIN